MSALPQNPRRPVRSQHRARGSASPGDAPQGGAAQGSAAQEGTALGGAARGGAPQGDAALGGAPQGGAAQRDTASAGVLGVLPYLLVLVGVAAGLVVLAWHGSRYAAQGTALVGSALLTAALIRLALPPRYAGLLATRGKAFDVLAFVMLGGGVLAVALMLP
jgi:hypothetical protein